MEFGIRELIGLTGLLAMMIGSYWGLVKLAGRQFTKHLDTQFAALDLRLGRIEESEKSNGAQISKLERDLLTLRAELPDKYVRREDYVRGQTVIESKLDALAIRLEKVQFRELTKND